MRLFLALAITATTVSFSSLLAPSAAAMAPGTAAGIQQGLANTSAVEQVVRVCRHRFFSSRRECWVDRSRPPTVCHWVRDRNGRMVRDCY